MIGVILCGGQSTRMGTDKGLIRQYGSAWAETAAEKLAVLNCPVVLSVNQAQYQSYSLVFGQYRLVQDDPTLDISGPLLGILSVHRLYPAEDLFVLACDMPLMDIPVIQQMAEIFQANKSCDAYVFTNRADPEPLCGIYTARGLEKVMQLYVLKKLPRYSMRFVLAQLNTSLTALQEHQEKYFGNFNSPDTLNNL